MQYPPLADGTYRYGDPPRPLPSPVPGPDASDPHAAPSPPPGAAPPHPAPPGHAPPHRPTYPAPHPGAYPLPAPVAAPAPGVGSGTRTALVFGGVLGAVLVLALGLAVLGSGASGRDTEDFASLPTAPLPPDLLPPAPLFPPGNPGSETFDVRGALEVTSSPGAPVSGDPDRCRMPNSLSDIGEGTTVQLRDPDGAVLATTDLAYDRGGADICTFSFAFERVPAGLRQYFVEITARGRIGYAEAELREGVSITLGR